MRELICKSFPDCFVYRGLAEIRGRVSEVAMAFKSINVLWGTKTGSLSIRCKAHNAPGFLMRGEDITMFCGHGGQCILGEWENMRAYREDSRKLKERIARSPLVNPQNRKVRRK
jgi:hypothetical protein